jgi:chromosome segregation ATPase
MSENLTRQLPEDLLRLILARLDSIDGRINGLEQRMTALEEKVDRRLQETRPIWEAVLARLDKIEERMIALETRMGGLETRMGGLETRMDNLEIDTRAGFRRVERVMGDAAKMLLEVQSYQNDLERRVDRLEPEPKR